MFEGMKEAVTPTNQPAFRPEMAFAVLSNQTIEVLRGYGTVERAVVGETLFAQGARQVDMWIVLSGSIEVFVTGKNNQSELIHTMKQYEFSGEFDMMNSQRTLATLRVAEDSELLRIPRSELRRIMREEGEIANLFIQALIWRRVGIIADKSSSVALIGCKDDAETILLLRFLGRNLYPHRLFEPPRAEVTSLGNGIEFDARKGLPAVVLGNGIVLYRPAIALLADELGITEMPDPETVYDVTVVGAGPAGLAASVYAASEGLSTLLVEGVAPGGQAGTSSKIENYLGFPTGIRGSNLSERAQLQALKFGVRISISREIVALDQANGLHQLHLQGGVPIRTRSVVVATGARYRRLAVDTDGKFENNGLYYAATAMESLLCHNHETIVVGGGNSAGQAAVFLSGIACHVHLVVRSASLSSTMSQYLISRIQSSSRITLHTDTEIDELSGETKLASVTWRNRLTGEKTTKAIRAVFVMIGAEPNTAWLSREVRLDEKGFVLTGGQTGFDSTPYATSVPGIYAVGDVRAHSIKRVASAVGEGSVVISDLHRYLSSHAALLAATPNSTLAAAQAAKP
jgi:thioredoxin reductase (NADPH)